MVIGALELLLRLDGCFSLKDKRRVVRSLVDRIHRDFRVSIAEVGMADVWNSSVVGVSVVTNDKIQAESVLQHVLDVFDASPDLEVEQFNQRVDVW